MQLDRFDAGVSFDGEQRIGRLDGTMLPRVAGKNQPRVSLTNQPDEFVHLPSANLPRLVHNHDRAG